MAFSEAHNRNGRLISIPSDPGREWGAPRPNLWPWLIAGVLGVALGAYVLAASSLPQAWGPLAVIAALFAVATMVVGDARRMLLAVILLDIPFPLHIHLGYREQVAELGAFGGLNLSVTTLSLVVLYAIWIADLLTRQRNVPRPRLRQSLPLALYVMFVALSVFAAIDRTLSLFEVALLVQTLLLYIYVASTVRTRRDVLFVTAFLMLGLALEGLVILGSQFFGLDFTFASLSTRADYSIASPVEFSRVAGTVGSPILAASYLALLLAPAASLLMARVGGKLKLLAALALATGGAALVLTFSRGGWITFGVSITIVCILAWRRGWLPAIIPVSILAAGLVLVVAFQDAIFARVFDEVTARDRVPLLELAFRLIRESPLIGVGANNFAVAMLQHLTPEFEGAWLYTVHNKYLVVWAETGLGALLAFLAFLFVTLRRGWRCWQRNDPVLSLLAIAFAAAILGQMIHMLVDVFHSRPQIQVLWMVAALITAMSNLAPTSTPDGEA